MPGCAAKTWKSVCQICNLGRCFLGRCRTQFPSTAGLQSVHHFVELFYTKNCNWFDLGLTSWRFVYALLVKSELLVNLVTVFKNFTTSKNSFFVTPPGASHRDILYGVNCAAQKNIAVRVANAVHQKKSAVDQKHLDVISFWSLTIVDQSSIYSCFFTMHLRKISRAVFYIFGFFVRERKSVLAKQPPCGSLKFTCGPDITGWSSSTLFLLFRHSKYLKSYRFVRQFSQVFS